MENLITLHLSLADKRDKEIIKDYIKACFSGKWFSIIDRFQDTPEVKLGKVSLKDLEDRINSRTKELEEKRANY
ncbi:hypothetical protein NKV53_06480 [Legionella sp. 27cVA30]|uniref:hypothetical protein n=1 Tax=Legionella sp. 27cVA30 TaxID=2905657 RepID=UPI0020A006F5|nr:hypothetical protein [Legionella sp. 27cVA30]MCP0913997.1 hypothetical protein [Legionella sp. 27cVA30]